MKMGVHLAALCLAAVLFTGCVSARFNPDRKYAAADLREDARMARDLYFKNHPSLDWYAPASEVEQAFENLDREITDSLSEPEFRLLLSKALASMHCGHTTTLSSRKRERYVKKYRYADWHFPLHVKAFGSDSMVVTTNMRRQSAIKTGDVVLSINGHKTQEIMDSLLRYIPGDGTSRSGRQYLLSRSFPAYFTGVYGRPESYVVTYSNADGKIKTDTLQPLEKTSAIIAQQRDTTRAPRRTPPPAKRPKVKRLTLLRNFKIDTANSTGFMVLNTFSAAQLHRFYRKSFRAMRKNKLENLVLDLRMNGGGRILNSTRLTRYLADEPFTVCDTLAAKNLNIHKAGLVPFGFIYPVIGWFLPKGNDGRKYITRYPKRQFAPRSKNNFDGNVYVLTGGRTYSASILFLQAIRHQSNITVIGEETGGAAYGNSATLIPEMRLPHSALRIRLPLFRCVIDHTLPQDGRGIIPDHLVVPGSFEIRTNTDAKTGKTYELIREKARPGKTQ